MEYQARERIEKGDYVTINNDWSMSPLCRHGKRRSECEMCKSQMAEQPRRRRLYALTPRRPTGIRRLWRWVQARFHWNDLAVCEMSVDREVYNDFHDYCDSEEKVPMHFHAYTCVRCGKEFII